MTSEDGQNARPPEARVQAGAGERAAPAQAGATSGSPAASPPARKARRWLKVVSGLLVVAGLVCGGLGYALFELHNERNSAFLREHFVGLVTKALGSGHELKLQSARLAFSGFLPRFELGGISIRNLATGGEVQLAEASFALSPASLLRLSPEARVVRFSDLRLMLPEADPAATTLHAGEIMALLRGTLAAIHIAIAGEEASFAALRSIQGDNITIFRRDAAGRPVPLRSGLSLVLAHSGAGAFTAKIERRGGQGMAMRAFRLPSESGHQVVLETGDLRAGSLFDLAGAALPGIDPGLTIALHLASEADSEGRLARSTIRITAKDGRIALPDEDMVPFVLEEGLLELRVNPAASEVEISRLLVRFNETHIEASGALTPIPEPGRGLALRLKAQKAVLDRLSTQEEVLELDSAEAEGELSLDLTSFRLERFDIAQEEGRARLSGRFSLDNGGLIVIKLEGGGFLVRKALRIWPIWVAPEARRWLVGHLRGGRLAQISLNSSLAGEVLRDALAKRPLPDGALALTFRLEQAELTALEDAAPLSGADASGTVSGRRARVQIDQGAVVLGDGRRIAIGTSKLVIADTARKPAVMETSILASGRLDALLGFLSAPSLRGLAGLPPNLAVAGGSFDALANLSIPLGPQAKAKDVKVEFKGDLKGVVLDNVVRGERLESSALTMVFRAGTLNVKGDARIFGVPGHLEVRVDARGSSAQLKTVLDDAVLAKRGIDLRPALSGSLGVTASLALSRADAPLDIEIDLARAGVSLPLPGVSKAVGQAGRAKFALRSDDSGHNIDNLEVDYGALSLRGKVEIGKDGAFRTAEFTYFKLSGGDNARLVAERVGKGYKLNLRGNSFDVRPFLKGVQSGKMEGGGAAVDFELDLATTVLVGYGGELMGAADLKLARRGGQITELNLKGQFGGTPLRITSQLEGKNTGLRILAEDGGALARFLDLYSRAHGGQMSSDVTLMPNNVQQGSLRMRDFVLRGEAGLRSVSANSRDGQAAMQGNDDVPFSRLKAEFHRRPGRMEVANAVMWGPQVGATLEGVLDYGADRVSVRGTFVPAYALNNLFAKVPLLGPILGGGRYEGLFAVPFVITGRASAPDLRVNPVSAIAPGFLRKIFEIRRETQ